MTSTRKVVRVLAASAVLAVALTACSSKGGAQNNQAAGGGAPGGKQYTIAMITHEQPGDSFWDKIRAGAEAAAKQEGVTLRYSAWP